MRSVGQTKGFRKNGPDPYWWFSRIEKPPVGGERDGSEIYRSVCLWSQVGTGISSGTQIGILELFPVFPRISEGREEMGEAADC